MIKPILQNAYVLGETGSGASSGISSSSTGSASALTLRVSPGTAGRLAFASDNGKVWVVLRPTTQGGAISPKATTLQGLLTGPRVPGGN